MTRLPFVLVVVSAVGLAACQRQAAPERTADAEEAAEHTGAPPVGVPPAEAPGESHAAPPGPAERPAGPAAEASRPDPPPVAPEVPAPSEAAEAEIPTPALTSSPSPEPRILAAGTTLPLVLEATVASNTSQVGDRVVASLAEDLSVDGRVILAAGTEVVGRVTAATQSGRVKGRARLAMEFDEVRDGGSSYRIEAAAIDITAESSKGKDAKIAGGAAAAGAIIGAIAGGGKGALKGGAIGGAAGGAAVLATRGNEVVLDAGARLDVTLERKVQID
jgi:hypothetical protein